MDVQQLFKSLKEEAECPLCLDTVKNPKTLPCLHSFCLECLDKVGNVARTQLQTTIKCPVCQTPFPIPHTDTFTNFPSSFYLNRLLDVLAVKDSSIKAQKCNSCDDNNPATSYCFVCQTFMCDSCVQSHQRFKATRGHRNVLIDKLQAYDVQELIRRPAMCSHQFHEGQPLEFYCEDCKVLICVKCSIVIHNRHSVTDTRKAALEQKMKLMEAVAKLKAEILLFENEIKTQTELKDKNVTDIMNAEKKMRDSVEEWIGHLREHEKKMKQRFREIYEAEQKQHETRLENLELITTQLKSCVERGQGVLERNISAEILQTNHTILQRCDELINARKSDRYKSPYLNYLVKRKFDTFDHIVVTKTDSSMCLAEFAESEIGKESNVVVVTRDSEGLQCYQLDDQIKVDILTAEGDPLKTELKDSKDGKYTVTYTPQCVGQHSVEIQVNGQPLTDSPFPLQIRQHHCQFSFKFGSRGRRVGEFAWISDIAVSDRTGTIAVADGGNNRIQLFSSDGNFQMQIKLDGEPYSVAFTDCNNLLSLVSGNNNKLRLLSEKAHCIKVFDKTGVYINDIGCKGSSDGQVNYPVGLVIDKCNQLIVCDVNNRRLQHFTLSGKFLRKLQGEYLSNNNPWYAALNNNGNLIVAGRFGNCIFVYS
ncbi:E3 ubiquitin-protein ligase TRIM71-like [Acropora millepora]|uniref:E3 ubiquitin-protein ligase TRIM71-like n=1 Tax=Acropora millepora TaxID=45264 RepID=UPI001CF0EFAD|nr:E3 ubiquitin-protein ligase TRIM71-like [Acropora millepora]